MKHLYLFISCLMSLFLYGSSFESSFNCAVQLIHQGNTQEALTAFKQAAKLNPSYAPTFFNIGLICLAQDNAHDAQQYLEQALALDPAYHRAYPHLAKAYIALGKMQDGICYYEKALTHGHDTVDTHIALARAATALKNNSLALEHLHKAVACDERNINALFELGYFFTLQQEYAQATEYYKKIIALYPHRTDVMYNLAHALRAQGDFQEARLYYQKNLEAHPSAHATYGYAECCLALGDFEHGFAAFESRWKREGDVRGFAQKLWDGSSLHGKTIILRAEYGQGDTIQCIRYAQLLKAQGATVILEAQHSLVVLLAQCPYLDRVIPISDQGEQLPAHDYQVPLMSLPYYCKTTLETIPCPIPYITVPQTLTEHWKQTLKKQDTKEFSIGICWEGSPYYEQFKSPYSKKSIPLTAFAPLAQLPNVRLYSLQKMNGTEQLEALPATMHVHSFGPSFDHDHGRFMDSAAVIQNLDLVITTDTSIAHLAGALGKRVWVALPLVADWRWMTQITTSPWYPTMRLFRQTAVGEWENVFAIMAQEVQLLITDTNKKLIKQAVSVTTEVQIGELLDKITILQIKNERIADSAKRANIQTELTSLLDTYKATMEQTPELETLIKKLKVTNEKMWQIEDDIRDKERAKSFDQEFIALARDVYHTNDERCRIKRDINLLTGSRLIEEKSYAQY